MPRTLSIIICILALALSANASQTEKPTVDQIIEKYVQALGGKAAIEKIKSRSSKGSFEIPAIEVKATAELYAKAPNNLLILISDAKLGTIRQGYNGNIAWAETPQTGLQELTGKELALFKRKADFHRALKLKELYPTMTLTGTSKVGDREVYVITATAVDGGMEKFYFDTQSGLLLRNDLGVEGGETSKPIEIYYEDYKDVDGVKVSFTTRQNLGNYIVTLKLSEVKQNLEIDDTKFSKPSSEK